MNQHHEHKKSFWSLRNRIISLAGLIAALGIIITAGLRAQTVVVSGCIDPHIRNISKQVYDTCHAKNQKFQDTVNVAIFGLIKEIRMEQKRESYIRDETVSDMVLARANAAFKRDSLRGERYDR